MVIHKLEKRVNSHQWNMVPIRIIAKCTVIPHDDFLSGPYVIYFYFMNIHSTSNLDKYMARSSCIWSRTAEQLHRHKVLRQLCSRNSYSPPIFMLGRAVHKCEGMCRSNRSPLLASLLRNKGLNRFSHCNEVVIFHHAFAPRHLKLGLKQRAHGNNLFCYLTFGNFKTLTSWSPKPNVSVYLSLNIPLQMIKLKPKEGSQK